MVKVFERLDTLAKLLITFAFALILVAFSHQPAPLSYQGAFNLIEANYLALQGLRDNARADTEQRYRPAIRAAAARAVPADAARIESASLYPMTAVFLLKEPSDGAAPSTPPNIPYGLPLDPGAIDTFTLRMLSTYTSHGTELLIPQGTAGAAHVDAVGVPQLTLDVPSLSAALRNLISRRPPDPATSLKFYIGQVGASEGGGLGTCALSGDWPGSRDPGDPVWHETFSCDVERNAHVLPDRPGAVFAAHGVFGTLPDGFGGGAYIDERQAIRDEINRRAREGGEKADFLGFKLESGPFLGIGPVIQLGVMLTMISLAAGAAGSTTKLPAEALFWTMQFRRNLAIVLPAITLTLLPTIAAGLAADALNRDAVNTFGSRTADGSPATILYIMITFIAGCVLLGQCVRLADKQDEGYRQSIKAPALPHG